MRLFVRVATLAVPMALLLAGCTYDYLQNTDRVAYRAGNAVRANIESETINPSKRSMYVTSGLGTDGYVSPQPLNGPPQGGATGKTASTPASN